MEKRTDKYIEKNTVRPKKDLDTYEAMASMFLFSYGSLTLVRGIFWLTESNPYIIQSSFYSSIAEWADLWGWGLLFIVTGLILLFACYALPKITKAKRFYWLLVVGGIATGIIYFLIGMAGFAAADSWLSPTQFMIISGTGLVVAYIGGAKLWKTKI